VRDLPISTGRDDEVHISGAIYFARGQDRPLVYGHVILNPHALDVPEFEGVIHAP